MSMLNYLVLNKDESDSCTCQDYNLYCIRKILIGLLHMLTLEVSKNVFKVDKIGKKYERSPYYIGTCLWNKLTEGLGISLQDVIMKNMCKLYEKNCIG